jgi:Kef-type K+ transport system membrane component KefB
MTIAIIVTLCVLVLIAYVFDLTASKTRIPAVILLLLLGWLLREFMNYFSIVVPDLSPALPVLGTIGLILIVLEGSLELELNPTKAPLIRKSFLSATIPLLLISFGLAWTFKIFDPHDYKINLINAIPFCVISSAIAIPTVRGLAQPTREFVVYESSLSDILGVLLFNFIAMSTSFGLGTFGRLALQITLMIIVSFVATIGTAYLLHRIEHHIKFVPIILLVILIYALSKVYHLPGLIFILIFGLFLGNLDELKKYKWIERLKPDELNEEVQKLKGLTIEGAFLIRTLFFLLFGYIIDPPELFNADTFAWALAITAAIFLFRAIFLVIFGVPLLPLLFIAPRGLITILLFLSIEPKDNITLVNRSLIIQVIVLTALVMMAGIITNKNSGANGFGLKKIKIKFIKRPVADNTIQ